MQLTKRLFSTSHKPDRSVDTQRFSAPAPILDFEKVPLLLPTNVNDTKDAITVLARRSASMPSRVSVMRHTQKSEHKNENRHENENENENENVANRNHKNDHKNDNNKNIHINNHNDYNSHNYNNNTDQNTNHNNAKVQGSKSLPSTPFPELEKNPIDEPVSVTTQLSHLSHSIPREPSMRLYRRRAASAYVPKEALFIDAGVPPKVPPHLVRRVSAANAEDSSFDSPRSRSRSSSIQRPQSLHTRSPSNFEYEPNYTQMYTRKCHSPGISLTRSDSESSMGSLEPMSPQIPHFALEGYHEGETKLRVVNQDDVCDSVEEAQRVAFKMVDQPRKYFVKSKAQIAEDEERLRKWYARYGHELPGQVNVR